MGTAELVSNGAVIAKDSQHTEKNNVFFFSLPAKMSLLAVFLQYAVQLPIIWKLPDISMWNMLEQLASLVKMQLYDLRLEISFASDAMRAALLPLRELPWGLVLIDGPLIHYAVTATVLLWPWVAFFWTIVTLGLGAAEITLQSQDQNHHHVSAHTNEMFATRPS